MPRAIWKGAISFGLVHIPVALVSATTSDTVDFDWLDKRSMEPVGYKRINKVTGKEVTKEHIVKGIEYEKGHYVVLTEDEIRTAHPKATQTIDIFAFVDSHEIPLAHIDTPYYLTPDHRGEKVYALLRETLMDTDKVALANVILHTKQHLAALMAIESALVLVLLRWPSEVRGLASLELSKATTHAELSKGERDMARRLVEDMTTQWQPDDYHNNFRDEIMKLVDQKAKDGKVENVETGIEASGKKTADIIDLTELLKRSLGGSHRAVENSQLAKTSNKKTTTKKSAEKADASKGDTSKTMSPSTKGKEKSSKTKHTGGKTTVARTASRK